MNFLTNIASKVWSFISSGEFIFELFHSFVDRSQPHDFGTALID
jgi:hypothetical protein